MAECAWDDVTIIRRKAPTTSQLKSTQAINSAQRRGLEIETSKKYHAGHNKQHQIDKNTAKLDRETEELRHETIAPEVGRFIQQSRQAKGLTQKDLATKINEKPNVVNDYEAGRAIPNQTILAKMERILEIKLRGKEKGQPILPKKK